MGNIDREEMVDKEDREAGSSGKTGGVFQGELFPFPEVNKRPRQAERDRWVTDT